MSEEVILDSTEKAQQMVAQRVAEENRAKEIAEERIKSNEFLINFQNTAEKELSYERNLEWKAYINEYGKDDEVNKKALTGMRLLAEQTFEKDNYNFLDEKSYNTVKAFLNNPKDSKLIKKAYELINIAKHYGSLINQNRYNSIASRDDAYMTSVIPAWEQKKLEYKETLDRNRKKQRA